MFKVDKAVLPSGMSSYCSRRYDLGHEFHIYDVQHSGSWGSFQTPEWYYPHYEQLSRLSMKPRGCISEVQFGPKVMKEWWWINQTMNSSQVPIVCLQLSFLAVLAWAPFSGFHIALCRRQSVQNFQPWRGICNVWFCLGWTRTRLLISESLLVVCHDGLCTTTRRTSFEQREKCRPWWINI